MSAGAPGALAAPAAVEVVVVGGGHSGLAMSHVLAGRGIAHVVLERGEVAQAWRSERWDSLRLLTPNWMCRLPGQAYDGDDPDGFMSAVEVAAFIARYAERSRAPVHTHTAVRRVEHRAAGGYAVHTDRGTWHCRAVVLATGACSRPLVPKLAADVPATVAQWTPRQYRRSADLGTGGVLVVGASATGVQLAAEIRASGRPVLLATGEHVRMPRLYRGRDVQWWLLESGVLDQRIEAMDDPLRARRLPSPQLVGSQARTTLDLNAVQRAGVEIVGRFAAVRGGQALFSGSLANVCALADLKMNRLLDAFDAWAREHGIEADVGPVQRFEPTAVPAPPRLQAALGSEIRTIVWATGYRPDFGWLAVPQAFDRQGQLRHDRGVVTEAPGLYALGLPFLRRRKSSFIHGAEDDVREIAADLALHLERQVSPPASKTPAAAAGGRCAA
ncbi:MAG: FAD-dependent oxidoreductase [Rubrivivax sp.]|nr:FAD-dependent oxidoreductase [Rubrivivax sp.]